MPRRSDARQKAIETSTRLFQRQGYHGTGLAQVLAESGAPKGSFYFHFPRGKEELALEAIAATDRDIAALIAAAHERSSSAPEFVRKLAKGLVAWLKDSNFEEGCLVAAFTLEGAADSEEIRAACQQTYERWRDLAAGALAPEVSSKSQARALGTLIVASFEGALLMGRAARDPAPVRSVGEQLAAHVETLINFR